jgi:hypothetical protein
VDVKRLPKRLRDLAITKTSGVDAGAHLTDGWGVLKGLDNDPAAASLLETILKAGAGVDGLADALTDAAVLADLDRDDAVALHKALGHLIEAEESVQKASLSQAEMNDLPDSSFAYIEPDGEKDGDGKTTPRSKRHFPIRTADGKPDAPHIRNALARASGSPFGDKAMGKITTAAKEAGIGDDDIEKAGRKMAGGRLDRLKQLHSGMGELLDEVDDTKDNEEEDPAMADDDKSKVDKSKLSPEAVAEIERLEKRAADAEAALAKAKEGTKAEPVVEDPIAKAAKDNPALAEHLAKQAAEVETLRKSVETEQAARVEAEFTTLAKSIGGGPAMATNLAKAYGAGPEVGKALEEAYRQTVEAQEANGVFKAIGGDGGGPDEDRHPLSALDTLAKARATEKGEDYFTAYRAVLDTPEGRAAYEASNRKAG